MRAASLLLVTLALGTIPALAQQASPTAPTPDQDGSYPLGPGIDPPYLTSPAMAAYPSDAAAADRPRIVRFTAVIAADGSVTKLSVIHAWGDAYESAATAAVQQSKFAPGTLEGKPVSVQVCIRVPFIHVQPAIPRLGACPQPGSMGPGGAFRIPPGVTPPRAIYVAEPEYSDQARRKKIQGVVMLSTLVNELGAPTDIRIEKSLGYGLDENAVRAVSQYRFQPATDRDGKPVAVRIAIEVSFRLY